jgi:tRNA1Val (adenine37-N6)-methyltransferase
MPDSVFHFKQFTIHQDKCAMKVGTDAVLLGSWVDPAQASHILDVGTGTGILAIMLAQKSSGIIDAVDIDESSCVQARENVTSSPWADKITVICSAFQSFVPGDRKYDLIVSNPPYFMDAPKPSSEARITARHTDNTLSFDELIDGVKKMLSGRGRFCVILPLKEGSMFKEKAVAKGLYCRTLVKIKTKKGKQEKRLIMEFLLFPSPLEEKELIIQEEDTRYTEEYLELTRDYYIGLREFRNFP